MPSDAVALPRSGLVVALDGPASSGKSSVGAAAATVLRYRFCDTGLLYRAVTWLALERGIPDTDAAALVQLANEVELLPDEAGRLAHVAVDGEDVTAAVRRPEVDAAVSTYARVPELRAALLERQRRIAAPGRLVMAGRDIGTVVLPHADLKLYLDATPEERARRRAEERGLDPEGVEAAGILEQLRRRDVIDASRPVAPLRAAPDAVHLRTDGNAFETTVALVVDAIRRREGEVGRAFAGRPPGSTGSDGSTGSAWPAGPRLPPAAAEASAPSIADPGPVRSRVHGRGSIPPTPVAARLTLLITIGSFVIRVLARLLTRVRIEGALDEFPRSGAVIVAANHASNADPVLIGGFLNPRIGRPMNWLGKREVFEVPVLSWLARHAGVHPVDRGAADVEAFRSAMRILEAGHVLAVFPEGTRSPDGRLGEAKDGVAVLAARSGATIVPIGVADSDRLWPKGRMLPRFTPSVTLTIGEPFRLAEALAPPAPEGPTGVPPDRAARSDRRRAKGAGTFLIMRRIAALLPQRQRGRYGDPPTPTG